jgi:hypothetical protein
MIGQMNLEKYRNKISEVIRTDATTVHENYFLITHSPFKQLNYLPSGTTEKGKQQFDEERFIEQQIFQKRNDHQFLIIQGDNGSGKSHFIRWIKERYIKEVLDEEAILFISRSQSTLRGTLSQIIESDLFNDQDLVDNLKKLIQANEHLNEKDLKRQIIIQFAASVQREEGEENQYLAKRDQKNLYQFLVEPIMQEFMFKEGGAIERIKLRLAAENTEQRLDDVSPRFDFSDFKIEYEELEKMKKDRPHNRALKLAEKLLYEDDHDVLKQNLADYLNQFLETVVQQCTNLRGSDLKAVFEDLRRELKKKGKNLTLFIEDITSFTGIDRALVEVLVTEHKGGRNEEFCRIFSIIGITNDYYRTSFPDNLKDRVTGRVVLDQASLTDENQIAEMAARYLNAIYLDDAEIEKWVQNGSRSEDYPLSKVFQEYDWALFQLDKGKTLPLFPFNKRALLNLYNGLSNKTPRMFLKDVLSHMLHIYFKKAPVNEFPPSIQSLDFDIQSWVNPLYERSVKSKSGQNYERMATFLRVWGDRTGDTKKNNGTLTVGGLPEEAFKAFGLPFIKDDQLTEEVIETGSEDTIGAEPWTVKDPKDPGIEVIEKPQKSEEKKKTKAELDFEKIQKELEEWMAEGTLYSYRELRDDLYDTLIDFIDWQSEGIPVPLVQQLLSKEKIKIEGQMSKGRAQVLISFYRSDLLREALLALSAWKYLGGKTWDFADSELYLLGLCNWMEQEKPSIIQAFHHHDEISEYDIPSLRRWGVLSNYYFQTLSGRIKADMSAKEIYQCLFQEFKLIPIEENRSNKWTSMQKRLNQPTPVKMFKNANELFRDFDNRIQGRVTTNTDIYFIDALPIIQEIEAFRKMKWNLSEMNLPEHKVTADISVDSFLGVLQELQFILDEAVSDEKAYLAASKQKMLEYTGGGNMKEIVPPLFDGMKNMLEFLLQHNQNYNGDDFEPLEKNELTSAGAIRAIESIDRVLQAEQDKMLRYLAQNPGKKMQSFLDLLDKFDRLLDKTMDRFRTKKESNEKTLADNNVTTIIQNTRDTLVNIKKDLTQIHQEV